VTARREPGLARLIGRVCLPVGIASALMPLGTYLWGGTATGFASMAGGFIVGMVLLTALQAREYTGS